LKVNKASKKERKKEKQQVISFKMKEKTNESKRKSQVTYLLP
jgi:hypothetical protein